MIDLTSEKRNSKHIIFLHTNWNYWIFRHQTHKKFQATYSQRFRKQTHIIISYHTLTHHLSSDVWLYKRENISGREKENRAERWLAQATQNDENKPWIWCCRSTISENYFVQEKYDCKTEYSSKLNFN